MARGWMLLIALTGCSQIFGLDDPQVGATPIVDARSIDSSGAYRRGLAMYGYGTSDFWTSVNGNTDPEAAWAKTTAVVAGGSTLWDGSPFASTANLDAVGITAPANPFAIWFEGEVMLAAGQQQINIDVDDQAYVYVNLTGAFQTITAGGSTNKSLSAPAQGWYPIRLGWGQTGGSLHFQLRHGGNSAFVAFTADELRTPGP